MRKRYEAAHASAYLVAGLKVLHNRLAQVSMEHVIEGVQISARGRPGHRAELGTTGACGGRGGCGEAEQPERGPRAVDELAAGARQRAQEVPHRGAHVDFMVRRGIDEGAQLPEHLKGCCRESQHEKGGGGGGEGQPQPPIRPFGRDPHRSKNWGSRGTQFHL